MKIITSPGSKNEDTQTLHLNEAGGPQASQAQAALSAWMNLDAKAISDAYAVQKLGPASYSFEPRKPSPFTKIVMNLSKTGHLETLSLEEVSGDSMQLKFGIPHLKQEN